MARNNNIGSISSGTMRNEDFIPEFIWTLRHQRPCKRAHRALCREIEARMKSQDYFESEGSGFDLEELFNALDAYAPAYFYFGSHPGDGADYGFWLSECWDEDFDGLKVDDLADVQKDYFGEVAVVNDHGNVSLYTRARNNRLVEIWSVV